MVEHQPAGARWPRERGEGAVELHGIDRTSARAILRSIA